MIKVFALIFFLIFSFDIMSAQETQPINQQQISQQQIVNSNEITTLSVDIEKYMLAQFNKLYVKFSYELTKLFINLGQIVSDNDKYLKIPKEDLEIIRNNFCKKNTNLFDAEMKQIMKQAIFIGYSLNAQTFEKILHSFISQFKSQQAIRSKSVVHTPLTKTAGSIDKDIMTPQEKTDQQQAIRSKSVAHTPLTKTAGSIDKDIMIPQEKTDQQYALKKAEEFHKTPISTQIATLSSAGIEKKDIEDEFALID